MSRFRSKGSLRVKKYSDYFFRPSQNVKKNVFIKKEKRNGLKILDCVVCQTYLVYGIDLQVHVKGQKHQNNLQDLERSCIWSRIRDEKKHSLVGLEYLVELVRTPEIEMLYVCMLCGYNGKSCEILRHFKKIEHKKKFLETHFRSYFRFISDETLLNRLCDEIEKLKGRLRPMVCFYQDFDENSLKIWKRIESGAHFTEENCADLITILKNQWKPKKKSDDDEPKPKRIKQRESSDAKKDLEQSRSTVKIEALDDGIPKFLDVAQEYLSNLTRTDLHNFELALELADKHKINNQKSSKGSELSIADQNDKTKEKHEMSLDLLDDLSISELNILIDNFESLIPKDQNHLVSFLQKMEIENPEKFKTLH